MGDPPTLGFSTSITFQGDRLGDLLSGRLKVASDELMKNKKDWQGYRAVSGPHREGPVLCFLFCLLVVDGNVA